MSVSCFPGYRSESDSSVSTGTTLDFPKQPSIESFFPAYKSESETDGSIISESNKTTPAAAQLLSYSIEAIFPPANSYKSDTDYGSSVSNETTPDFSKQLSIPSLFPPYMSESDTNENYETLFSYSIVSFFPPARSLTDSSQYYEIIPTDTSIATTIDSVGYKFDIFWSSQQSVPILDLNSSESSPIHKNQVIGTCVTATIFATLEEIRSLLESIRNLPPRNVSYMPLNSSESSRIHEIQLIDKMLAALSRILEVLRGLPNEKIQFSFVMRRFPLRQVSYIPLRYLRWLTERMLVSYIPLRYLRWLKECMLKRTIAISSTTQK